MINNNTCEDSKTIFLVEEDTSAVDLYSNRFELAGFRTTSAFNAEEAFEALPNLSADLIILDLMQPKLGSFELLQAIRLDNRHKNTPVLVFSNVYLPDMAKKALRVGGNRALAKSECTTSELISVSRELVGFADAADTDGPAGSCGRRATEGPVAAGLAEQLKKALVEKGSSEIAAMRLRCLRYIEVVGSEEG